MFGINQFFNQKHLGSSLLIMCFAAMIALSYCGLIKPLGHDEAFFLQAVDLLAKGQGYASYGVMRGDGPWLFDPHITVGPVVLIPLSLLWRVSEGDVSVIRIFMGVVWFLYVVGLFRLFYSERSGLLVPALAIASSLCIVKVPAGVILGEMPAATAIVWAAYATRKNRPFWAALLAGMAVQIKLVFALAGLIVLLAYLLPVLASPSHRIRYRHVLNICLLFACPTLLFELSRFLSFDSVESWQASLDEFRHFLQTQNVNLHSTWLDTHNSKLAGVRSRLPTSAWLGAGVALLSLPFFIGIAYTHRGESRSSKRADKFPLAASIGLIIAGTAMLTGWINQSAQLSSRQALPLFLFSIPSLFALGGHLYLRSVAICHANSVVRFMALSSIAFCFLALAITLMARIEDTLRYEVKVREARKAEQQQVVNIIRRTKADSLFVDTYAGGYFQSAPYQLLSPIRAVPMKTGGSQIMIVSTYLVRVSKKGFPAYMRQCGKMLYSSQSTLVCRLPEFDREQADIQVLAWGPTQTAPGVVPNKQPNGGAGFYIRVTKHDVTKIGPVKIYFSGQPAFSTVFTGQLITGSLPSRFFNKLGKYEVSVKQLVTGRAFHVGYFTIGA